MFQKLSLLLRKSRRGLLSVVLGMLKEGYSAADVESVLRAARDKKLKGSQIRAMEREVRQREAGKLPYAEVVRVIEADFGHARSMAEQECVDEAGKPIPGFTYPATGYAGQLDFSACDILEFGSGNSTLFWAGRARRVVAVERNPEIYRRMKPLLPAHVDYRSETDAARDGRMDPEGPESFHVIVINGLPHLEGVGSILEKLRPDGMVIVDHADWYPGFCAELRGADLIQVDMQGLGPVHSYAWTTSFFIRRAAAFLPLAARQPVHGPGSKPKLMDLPVEPRTAKPSLNGLDDKLAKYLAFRGGFFIEAGANDGFNQSNTYYLENSKGWRGLLVEGIPELAAVCRKVRARSRVVNTALVADQVATPGVTMRFANLMSLVEGSMSDRESAGEHIRQGVEIQGLEGSYEVVVPARTLTSLCQELIPDQSIDFFSLDVEGFEVEVLKGLDLEKVAPKFILVETYLLEAVAELLSGHYDMIEKLTVHDYLFRRKDLA